MQCALVLAIASLGSGAVAFAYGLYGEKCYPLPLPSPSPYQGQGGARGAEHKGKEKDRRSGLFPVVVCSGKNKTQSENMLLCNAVWCYVLPTYTLYNHPQAVGKDSTCIRSYTTHCYNIIKPPICQVVSLCNKRAERSKAHLNRISLPAARALGMPCAGDARPPWHTKSTVLYEMKRGNVERKSAAHARVNMRFFSPSFHRKQNSDFV